MKSVLRSANKITLRGIVKWPSGILFVFLVSMFLVSGWYRVSFVSARGPTLWFKEGLCVFGNHDHPYGGDVGIHVGEHIYSASYESRFYWRNEWPYWYAAIPIWVLLLVTGAIAIPMWIPDLILFRRHGLQESPRARKVFRWAGAATAGVTLMVGLVSIWLPLHWTDAQGRTFGIGHGSLWLGYLGYKEGWSAVSEPPEPRSATTALLLTGPTQWLGFWRGGANSWALGVPLWMQGVCGLVVFGFALRQERAAARRPRRNGKCSKCDYDVSGLAVGAPCPECGMWEAPTRGG